MSDNPSIPKGCCPKCVKAHRRIWHHYDKMIFNPEYRRAQIVFLEAQIEACRLNFHL